MTDPKRPEEEGHEPEAADEQPTDVAADEPEDQPEAAEAAADEAPDALTPHEHREEVVP